MMSKLYEITARYKTLETLLEDENIEIEQIKEALDLVEEEITEKADNIAKFIKSLEADEKAIKEEEKRLYDRRKGVENKRESLKQYLYMELENAGIRKVKSTLFNIGIQNNPPSVNIIDQDKISAEYITTEIIKKVDKRAILEKLKNGEVVEGAEIRQGQSLRIR